MVAEDNLDIAKQMTLELDIERYRHADEAAYRLRRERSGLHPAAVQLPGGGLSRGQIQDRDAGRPATVAAQIVAPSLQIPFRSPDYAQHADVSVSAGGRAHS